MAVGGGWWLVIDGWWQLALVGGWRLVAAGGCQLAVGGGWRLVAVGGWRLVVPSSSGPFRPSGSPRTPERPGPARPYFQCPIRGSNSGPLGRVPCAMTSKPRDLVTGG